MFGIDRFAADCRAALAERGSEAIRDVVGRAVSDPAALIAALGEHNGPHAAVLVTPLVGSRIWHSRQAGQARTSVCGRWRPGARQRQDVLQPDDTAAMTWVS
jgi:hypothetical protein